MAALIPKVSAEINQEYHQEIDKQISENPDLLEIGLKRKNEIDQILNKRISTPPDEIWHKVIEAESQQYVKLLSSMKWVFWVQENCSFLTCDNPVFYFNEIGIAGNEHSELSFPISSNIMLWGSWHRDIRETYKTPSIAAIKEFNRRTAHISDRFVYSQKNEEWILPFISKPNFKLNRII